VSETPWRGEEGAKAMGSSLFDTPSLSLFCNSLSLYFVLVVFIFFSSYSSSLHSLSFVLPPLGSSLGLPLGCYLKTKSQVKKKNTVSLLSIYIGRWPVGNSTDCLQLYQIFHVAQRFSI
jgi:hypothetical protein